MRWRIALLGLAALLTLAASAASASSASNPPPIRGTLPPLPSSFRIARHGIHGGSIWEGRIPNPYVPTDKRPSAIYLPPGYTSSKRYPVLYLLHGFWGSPSSFVDSFHIVDAADELIVSGRARPFIIVMPPGGAIEHGRTTGEWAGVWEQYVVDAVVPWTDAHLPTFPRAADRAIGGLSAGAFGAVDIALRHLGTFGVAESWEGYFRPFRDGPLARATPADLAAHDPTLLVRQHAKYVRTHIQFFLSTGGSHGGVNRKWTFQFAKLLGSLGMQYRLWVLQPDQTRFGRSQLPDALAYAEPGASVVTAR
jgi:S-formylglutathione hydrolase FrmB